MWPVLNGVKTKVFKHKASDDHAFRNRSTYEDADFELLGEILAQPVFFSSDYIQKRKELGYFDTSGYFILRTKDLSSLGIEFSQSKKNWQGYRLLPYINGEYAARFLEVIEARPKSPLKGSYLFWELYFKEVLEEGTIKDTFSITPKVDDFETIVLTNA